MIVKLKAGLGNMMFQYAFGRMLSLKYNINDIKYDIDYYRHEGYERYLNSFEGLNTSYIQASNDDLRRVLLLRKIYNPKPYTLLYRLTSFFEWKLNSNYYLQRGHDYILPDTLSKYAYLDGYWQSWRYLTGIKKELISDFSLKISPGLKYESLKKLIMNCNSVALCVRKGDYLSTSHTKKHFYQCTPQYYSDAIKYIESKVENPVFYVFTNDEQWVSENLKFRESSNVIFRNKDEVYKDYEELHLISSCKHAIISNSTFHWWGAWLNQNTDSQIVVRPKYWFADGTTIDIYPPEWIELEH